MNLSVRKRFWIPTALIGLLIVYGLLNPQPQESASTSSSGAPQVELGGSQRELSRDDKLAHAVIGVVGTRSNWGDNSARLISARATELFGGPDEGGYTATIKFRADDNLTSGLVRAGIVRDSMEIIEALATDPDLADTKVYFLQPHLPLVDDYGKKSVQPVAKVLMRKAVADRIDWENMTADRFEQLAKREGEFRFF